MAKHFEAFSFASPLSLQEIAAKFIELSPWQWIPRCSDDEGDYFSTLIGDTSRIKLYEPSRGRYDLDIKWRGSDADWAAVHQMLDETLLPAIGASDRKPIVVRDR